ncbi:MAG: response regulator transcription factor [Gammaproteobacteria bacterium]|nr:response regulator transcription factor [Gammaproteobacteria bacterium]NNF61846.1 response regulator transcription factor [Gammaproteobacteria bacterium]
MQQTEQPTVYIVDDDEAVRDSLSLLMEAASLPFECFATANDFLENRSVNKPGCLVLDIRMPGMTGLELRDELHRRNALLPIIFITGHGDVPMAVDAMKHGAVDFIQKPFADEALLDRIQQALELNATERSAAQLRNAVHNNYLRLTPREREVMAMVVSGNANKVIAQDLGVSQRTVEIHRARVMEKMQARSIAQLVQQAGILDK